MRIASLTAAGRDVGKLCTSIASQAKAFKPSALLWVTDCSLNTEKIAECLSLSCAVSVGGVSRNGLIGAGSEFSGAGSRGDFRVCALAIGYDESVRCLPFSTRDDSLPSLPNDAWAKFAAASPDTTPHLLLLASPPEMAAFPFEKLLSRLDTTLPWAKKVGGLTAGGDSRLWVGSQLQDGGCVGLALDGIDMDVLVCQGALPVSPSWQITASEGNIIRGLDGQGVAAVLNDALEKVFAEQKSGNIMAGISVPTHPAIAAMLGDANPTPIDAGAAREYVVRSITGYSRQHSVLAVGASPDLLEAPGARLQLHWFSAENAKAEVTARATALAKQIASSGQAASAGGMMVSCLGRGQGLFGENDVEPSILAETFGSPLELTGWFAGGEVGPVGAKTHVHTYTSALALLRTRQRPDGV